MNDRLTRSRKADSYHSVNTPQPLWICVSETKLHQRIKATGRRSFVAGLESAVVASSIMCSLPAAYYLIGLQGCGTCPFGKCVRGQSCKVTSEGYLTFPETEDLYDCSHWTARCELTV